MAVAAAIVACSSSPYGQGGENACQFVKEQVPELRDDIAKVEVVAVDTVTVYDLPRLSEELRSKETDTDAGLITCKELRGYADSINRLCEPRIVYSVVVTMKSSQMQEVDVIMEDDGTTPYMLRNEYEKIKKPFYENMLADEVMVCESDLEDK